MTQDDRAVITIRLRSPQTFVDVEGWVAIANQLGVPSEASVSVNSVGTPHMQVSAWLDQLPDQS